MANRITIYVKCTSATQLYWKESGGSWAQLVASGQPNPPEITDTSREDVTVEFLKDANSQYPILYSPTGSGGGTALPTSNGPTIVISPPGQEPGYFAKEDDTPGWYYGYVTISDD